MDQRPKGSVGQDQGKKSPPVEGATPSLGRTDQRVPSHSLSLPVAPHTGGETHRKSLGT